MCLCARAQTQLGSMLGSSLPQNNPRTAFQQRGNVTQLKQVQTQASLLSDLEPVPACVYACAASNALGVRKLAHCHWTVCLALQGGKRASAVAPSGGPGTGSGDQKQRVSDEKGEASEGGSAAR